MGGGNNEERLELRTRSAVAIGPGRCPGRSRL